MTIFYFMKCLTGKENLHCIKKKMQNLPLIASDKRYVNRISLSSALLTPFAISFILFDRSCICQIGLVQIMRESICLSRFDFFLLVSPYNFVREFLSQLSV